MADIQGYSGTRECKKMCMLYLFAVYDCCHFLFVDCLSHAIPLITLTKLYMN